MVALARLLPHPDNFTPLGAFALFAGAYIEDKKYLLLPLAALLIGDMISGFYSLIVMVFVYIGFSFAALIGRGLMRRERTLPTFVASILLGAISFYLISNVGMWWIAHPRTAYGLYNCWIEGLPFLLRTIGGDFIYGIVIFGIVESHRHFLPTKYAT